MSASISCGSCKMRNFRIARPCRLILAFKHLFSLGSCMRNFKLTAHFLLICAVSLFVCFGCTRFGNKVDDLIDIITGEDEVLSAQELAWSGMDEYDDKEYKKALEHFQNLKDNYPFSKYAILAELKTGDCHYHLQQYAEAIFAYEEFEKLHPRNEAIVYVIYQIGLSYFEQIGTIDRDQNAARNALETFRRLQKQFPDDQYARTAEDHITACIKSLVGHEYTVGVFYYKTKHYEAALNRFMTVLSKYPDVGYHQQSLEYIAKCETKIAGRDE